VFCIGATLFFSSPKLNLESWLDDTDSRNFTVSKAIAAARIEVEPGAIRKLHWHPNADEWQYYLSGQGRMTVFASGGKSRTFDYQAGDVGYVPRDMGHYVENTGEELRGNLAGSMDGRPAARVS
jgi:oxalate decarboxylase/phosphoglucose isomerase-like protein (cupin superfamily)